VTDVVDEVARLHAVSWLHPDWEAGMELTPMDHDFAQDMKNSTLELRKVFRIKQKNIKK
jgi:hypothetical protein